MTPTSPDDEATPADPGAIDLAALKNRYGMEPEIFMSRPHNFADICQLIAAVEALREHLAGYETVFDLAQKRERPWIEAWRKATGKPDTLPDYGEMLGWLCGQIEAAEAHEAALAGALEKFREHVLRYATVWKAEGGSHHHPIWSEVADILAATPEDATKRGKSKDQAYLERNHLVAALARLYPSGIRQTDIPGWSPDWHGCVYIDLPTGQVSYHYHDSHAPLFEGLPDYEGEWDGHDKELVHQRLANIRALGKEAP